MRTWVLSAMAAVAIGLGFSASNASAAWVYPAVYPPVVVPPYVPAPAVYVPPAVAPYYVAPVRRAWVPNRVHYRYYNNRAVHAVRRFRR
jgi:hypothetical protein